MWGQLPSELEIGGKRYAIRTDFRIVLQTIDALNAEELSQAEKLHVLLYNIFVNWRQIPREHYAEACEKALDFIACGQKNSKKNSPQIIAWEKDEQLLFAAVNSAAGQEVRAIPCLHWFTFMGYFQSIGSESTYGTVLMLRQKRAKGKKLEKWEQEFWDANRDICELKKHICTARDAEDALAAMFEEILAEQKAGGGTDG